MAKQGRKLLLNEAMIAKIVEATQYGNYATVICDYVGISTVSLANWLRKGEELSEKDEDELNDEERLFVKLFFDVRKARGLSEMRAVERIRKAGEQDWKAAAWFLERTATARWGRVDRTEITGADGGAIAIDAEVVSRKLEAMMANQGVLDAKAIEDAQVHDATIEAATGLLEAVSREIVTAHSDEPSDDEDDSTTVE